MDNGDVKPAHVAIGNLNLDISVVLDEYPEEDSHVFASDSWIGLGGAATNYSVAVAGLGHEVYLVARAGGDALKLGLFDQLMSRGVRVDYISVAPKEPLGTVMVLLVPNKGTRTMITIRGANRGLQADHVPRIEGARVYHLASTNPSILEKLCTFEWWRKGFIVSYDPGGEVYRFPRRIIESLHCIDLLLANEREVNMLLKHLGGHDPRNLIDVGVRLVVVKRGSGGAIAYTPDSRIEAILSYRPRIIDVTGAGDAFDAAFNVAFTEHGSVETAIKVAVAAGAAKVELKGSTSMPDWGRINMIIKHVYIKEV